MSGIPETRAVVQAGHAAPRPAQSRTAQPRPVSAGEWTGDDWLIGSGLKAGDKVIVDGVMKLGPGAPVRVAEGKPAAQPPAKK